MPAKPPPPPPSTGEDYEAAARRKPERVTLPRVLGVQVPPRLIPSELEPTRNDLPRARRQEAAQQTQRGLASVAATVPTRPGLGDAPSVPPQAPLRSDSPGPESVAAQVKIGSVSLPPIRKRHLRALWVWVAPVIATLLTSAFGYVRGYAKGLADAAERLAKIETRADALGVREAKVEARMADVETKAESVEDAQAAEAKSNRTERATRDLWHRDDIDAIEQLKKAFRIEGLPKK